VRRFARPALVTAIYLLLTCAFYWQGVRHMASHFISDSGDGADFVWNYWALPHLALHGHNPFATNLIFWPVGVRLGFHTTTPIEAFAFWPLSLVFGRVLASNLLLLAAVPATAWGANLLARHECGDWRVSAFAGAAYAFIPERLGRINGHWNLHHGWVLPFALLALLRLYDKPNWPRAVALGLMAAVVFATDLTYFVFFAGAALVLAAWRGRATIERRMLTKLGAAAAVAFVAALPLIAGMFSDLRHHELDRLADWGGADIGSANVLGYVVPSTRHPIWGALSRHLHVNFGMEQYPYVGVLVLLLALGGLFVRRRQVAPWLVLAAGSVILSFGPFLQFNGWTGSHFSQFGRRFDIPLPYEVFHSVPVLSALRVPGRFAFVAALALDVAAAITLAKLIEGRSPRWQWTLPALALVITVVELLPPPDLRLQSPNVPAAYRVIQRAHDEDAVLEVPLFWRDGFGQFGDQAHEDSIFLYYATRHGHPVSNGMVARLSGARKERLTSIAPYAQLLALQHQTGFSAPATFAAADLRAMGIGYVVYHRDRPMPDALAYLQTLGLRQLADDGTVVVWRVPTVPTG
jgi:hypothetical protein